MFLKILENKLQQKLLAFSSFKNCFKFFTNLNYLSNEEKHTILFNNLTEKISVKKIDFSKEEFLKNINLKEETLIRKFFKNSINLIEDDSEKKEIYYIYTSLSILFDNNFYRNSLLYDANQDITRIFHFLYKKNSNKFYRSDFNEIFETFQSYFFSHLKSNISFLIFYKNKFREILIFSNEKHLDEKSLVCLKIFLNLNCTKLLKNLKLDTQKEIIKSYEHYLIDIFFNEVKLEDILLNSLNNSEMFNYVLKSIIHVLNILLNSKKSFRKNEKILSILKKLSYFSYSDNWTQDNCISLIDIIFHNFRDKIPFIANLVLNCFNNIKYDQIKNEKTFVNILFMVSFLNFFRFSSAEYNKIVDALPLASSKMDFNIFQLRHICFSFGKLSAGGKYVKNLIDKLSRQR